MWNDQQREAYVQNVAGHFSGVKSAIVKERQRAYPSLHPSYPLLTPLMSRSLRLGRRRPRAIRPHRGRHRPPQRRATQGRTRVGG